MQWNQAFAKPVTDIPVTKSLYDTWEDVSLLRLHFTIRSEGMIFPPFHGALWHGVIGAQLRQQDPLAYLQLWEAAQGGRYALRAPFGPTEIAAGQNTHFEITLWGDDIPLVNSVVAAVMTACQSLGTRMTTHRRGSAALEAIHAYSLEGPTPLSVTDETSLRKGVIRGGDLLNRFASMQPSAVRLTLESPLRFKDQNQLLRQHPTFPQLVKRLFGRLRQIRPETNDPAIFRITDDARQIQSNGSVVWQDWARYSARQHSEMAFGGLTGFLEYQGEQLTPFLPWLALGEWLQIGGKTTFGFGAYRLNIASS
ncbi:MAG: CRISPR system precrRNA processing endoribonuclease RAMP protein Cas6 [Acidithiobacillus sp.]